MHHLRPKAIAGLLLAVMPATLALSSCGFDYPTDRVNTIGAGVNNRDADVDALGIRILATAQGEGRLIGALSNNLRDEAALEDVTSPDGILQAAAFEPVELGARAGVNLAAIDPIALTGDFTAGQVVPIELVFSSGESVSVDAPVVKPCFQYADVPTAAAPAAKGAKAQDGAAADAAAEEEGDHSEGGDATFNCADEAPAPEGEH